MAARKNILIASVNRWSFCLAVERQVARENAQNHVDLLDLFELTAIHSPHWRPRDVMIERLDRKLARFVKPLINGREITSDIRTDPSAIPPIPEDIRDLRCYSVDGARVGLGIISSLLSITTVQTARRNSDFGPLFEPAWRSAHLSLQVGRAVSAIGYDEVHIFNGRHCHERPFCDVLDQHTRVIRYEQGATGNSYVQSDRPIHHPAAFAELVRKHDFSPEAGEGFYQARLSKAPGNIVSFFTAGQQPGELPAGVKPKQFVAFFTSSSDELMAISDDLGFGGFASQSDAALAMACQAARSGKRLVVRLHPHLQYKHPSWREEWDFDSLRAAGALIVEPESSCDSYALGAAAHCVFTCGSTMGFECTFQGVPTAEVGEWIGYRLGATRAVRSEAELVAFLEHPTLREGAHDAALLYGSYLRRGGTPLPEYEIGPQPNYARIGRRIVDPVRYVYQSLRDAVGLRSEAWGMVEGKAILDSNLEAQAKKKGFRVQAS